MKEKGPDTELENNNTRFKKKNTIQDELSMQVQLTEYYFCDSFQQKMNKQQISDGLMRK